MGLFDDDFYSTKVSKRVQKGEGSPLPRNWSRKPLRSMSTLQVSLLSSLVSVVVTALLFSLLTGNLAGTQEKTSPAVVDHLTPSSGDPYDRIIQAAAMVRPAVVSITNHKDAGPEEEESFMMDQSSLGSGVIYKIEDNKAFIITNNHVVENAGKLEIVTMDGTVKKADLVGADKVSDIAVLSVDADGLHTVAQMGDSSNLRWGEAVFAIGNPLGFGDTLTFGIVSNTQRTIPVSLNQDGVYDWEQDVIQTDAAINEGNSGGALVNLKGQVIGINTMKISDMGVEGLGFAIPSNTVMETANELAANGKIVRSYLGVYTVDLNNPYVPLAQQQLDDLNLPEEVTSGVLVLDSVGPAQKAGLELNDVITEFNGQPVSSTLSLRKYLYNHTKIGDSLQVTYYRDGNEQHVSVKLEAKPEE